MTEEIVPVEARADEAQNPDLTFVPQPVPVTLHLSNGKVFVVSDVHAWGYMEQGVFATGKFKGYTGETDILVPYSKVEYYEFNYDALKRFVASAAAAEQEADGASPSA